MLPATASLLEVSWTAIAFCGAAVAMALLVHVWLSYRAVMSWIEHGWAYRWGPRHKFALGFLVGIGLLLLVWCGFIALGANAIVNPPPTTPDREAASERGGWILVCLEGVLFVFQTILTWAWMAVGAKTLHPHTAHELPSLGELVIHAIDAGREMGHGIANDLQRPVAVLDEIALTEGIDPSLRTAAAVAVADLDHIKIRVAELHARIKAMEPQP